VFDFGPPFGLRARVGQSVPLMPPFGAVFVAWSEQDAARWIARGDASLTNAERARYRTALSAVRRRGYSVSVATRRRSALADALDAVHASADPARVRQARDEAIKEMMHSDYLPAELNGGSPVRVSQLSAPIFDHTGHVVASVMVLGPEHDLTNREIRSIGEALVRAAQRATQQADDAAPGDTPTAAFLA
jgi:DNA-binding IclR family transcriptional regulator